MALESQWRDRTVLITGGTGLIGRHVVEMGRQIGAQLHVLARSAGHIADVTYHSVDIADSEAVHNVVKLCQPLAIIHLVAAGVGYGSSSPRELFHTNIIGLQTILEAALTLEKRTPVLIADTGFVYAPQNRPIRESDPIQPFNAYAASKAVTPTVAGLYVPQLSIVLLRLFSVYSPHEKPPRLLPHIVHTAEQGKAIDLTAGTQVRDYAYAGDVAEAFWRALSLDTGGQLEIINVGTGQAVRVREFVELAGEILTEGGLVPQFNVGALPHREGELMSYVPDIHKMQDRLGWTPTTDLKSGLRLCVEVMLEQIG